jgi:site-specific recombinase XerD
MTHRISPKNSFVGVLNSGLARYENNPRCLNKDLLMPVLSNQKMNDYLKQIADLSGIDKVLTFHIARHTFATTITLSNAVHWRYAGRGKGYV